MANLAELMREALDMLSDTAGPDSGPLTIWLSPNQAANDALVAGLRRRYPGAALYKVGMVGDEPELIE